MISKITGFIQQARRVLLVSTKPDRHEFRQSVKITGIGMVILGTIGFLIFLAVQIIGGL